MALDPVTAGLDFATNIVKRIWADPAQQSEATQKVLELAQTGELAKLQASSNIIVAEANSEHALTSQWRPITMLTFVAIIANNYLLYPYLSLLWEAAPLLPLPPDLWDLIKIGLGGYVVSRGIEKTAKEWKKND